MGMMMVPRMGMRLANQVAVRVSMYDAGKGRTWRMAMDVGVHVEFGRMLATLQQ
jgi:hypothetical protein